MLNNSENIRASLENSIRWMLTQLNDDGTVNPLPKGAIGYYKLPWAFILAGKYREAKQIIDWTVRETFSSDGDLKSDKRQKFHLDFYTYPNTWICLAAHLLSLFELSYPMWNFITTFQDPETGGYCSKTPWESGKDILQDAISTAWSSMTGLYLGKIEEAEKGASFLQTLMDEQPDFTRTFYYYRYSRSGLVREKPEEEPDDRFIRINMKEKEENFYYILGAVVSFLAKLASITKDPKHLDLAKTYFDFVVRAGEHPFNTESCGKLCFAAANLYEATRDIGYLEWAERFVLSLLKIGEADGSWIRGGKPTVSSTAEFCVWRTHFLNMITGVSE